MLGIQQEGIKLTFDQNLALLEKYKAMHKEEHRKTYYQGVRSNFQDFYGYYIETFGGNNEQQ